MPSLRELNYNGMHTWVKDGVIIKDNVREMASNFLLYFHQFLKENDINDDTYFVVNVNEIPVWHKIIYEKVMRQIGNKHAAINSFNCDKLRISLTFVMILYCMLDLLTILSNKNKLATLVVFRGKTDDPLEK
jgi:hypothetical protein